MNRSTKYIACRHKKGSILKLTPPNTISTTLPTNITSNTQRTMIHTRDMMDNNTVVETPIQTACSSSRWEATTPADAGRDESPMKQLRSARTARTSVTCNSCTTATTTAITASGGTSFNNKDNDNKNNRRSDLLSILKESHHTIKSFNMPCFSVGSGSNSSSSSSYSSGSDSDSDDDDDLYYGETETHPGFYEIYLESISNDNTPLVVPTRKASPVLRARKEHIQSTSNISRTSDNHRDRDQHETLSVPRSMKHGSSPIGMEIIVSIESPVTFPSCDLSPKMPTRIRSIARQSSVSV